MTTQTPPLILPRLNCDAVTSEVIRVEWEEAFAERAYVSADEGAPRAELIRPNFEEWTSAELYALLNDQGISTESLTDHDGDGDAWRDSLEAAAQQFVDDDDLFRDYAQPMMNFAYPVPGMTEAEAGRCQCRLSSLTLVRLDDRIVLALTGGGMDLSPEICAAYIACGYLPPFQFVSGLPEMASVTYPQEFLGQCMRTTDVVEAWLQSARASLAETHGAPIVYEMAPYKI